MLWSGLHAGRVLAMGRRRASAVALAVALIAVASYYLRGSIQNVGSQKSIEATLIASGLELGDVWAMKEKEVKITLKNDSSASLNIQRLASTCSCTKIDPDTLTLSPHASSNVNLLIKMLALHNAPGREAVKDFRIGLFAVVDGQDEPVSWTLGGRIVNPVVPSVQSVHFGLDELNSKLKPYNPQIVELEVNPKIKRVTPISDRSLIESTIELVKDGQHPLYRLTIRPSSELPLGPFVTKVDFDVVDDASDEFVTTPLSVSGVIVDDLEFLPAQMNFAPSNIGDVLEDRILVRSRTNGTFSIEASDCTEFGTSAVPENSQMSTAQILHIKQKIMKAGPNLGTVELKSRAVNGDRRTVRMAVQYYGLQQSQ